MSMRQEIRITLSTDAGGVAVIDHIDHFLTPGPVDAAAMPATPEAKMPDDPAQPLVHEIVGIARAWLDDYLKFSRVPNGADWVKLAQRFAVYDHETGRHGHE